ncbi:Glucokinase [Phycisphaerae bacterium RAS1]|nr:Glucokinase [Phycisphaerae bacterium RAS1]
MEKHAAIGIDIGGTNIKAGLFRSLPIPLFRRSIDTQASAGFEHVFTRLIALIDAMLADAGLSRDELVGIGVGAPGPMSYEHGVIHNAPNLPGWENVPLRERLREATGVATVVENDANAAAYGEFIGGAGRGSHSLVLLTLGTGIGGGIVLDGRVWRGRFDNAGEVGHMLIEPGGRPCPCGQSGCLERYASAAAVAERAVEAIRAGQSSELAARVAKGAAIDARDVLRAADEGDELCGRIWDDAARWLATACVTLRHLLNPELIIFSGGMVNAAERLLEPVQRHFDALSWKIAPDAPRLAIATLGPDAGMTGAAALAGEIQSEPRV